MTGKSVLAGLAVAAVAATALAVGQGTAQVTLAAPDVGTSAVTLTPDGIEFAMASRSRTRHATLRIGGSEAAGFFKEATG
jgi:hypothetical protein